MALHPTICWNDVVNAAVLGFDRAGAAACLPAEAAPWSVAAAAAADRGVEAVLSEIASLAIYELAGRMPATGDGNAALPACDAQDRVCSRMAAQQLVEILHGGRKSLLPHWVAAAAAGGWNAPREAIVVLLDLAAVVRSDAQRQELLAVTGNCGRWIAQLNPRWRTLWEMTDAAASIEDWETSSRDERMAMLRRLRRSNREAAQRLVEKTWDAESAADRAMFLEQFAMSLSEEDQSWLESRLDDRSKQVRSVAAELLSRLPGSALSERMAARARSSVRLSPGGGLLKKKPPKIEVTLPEEADAALKRDGVEPRTQRSVGAKASLLSQIVALAPLHSWRQVDRDDARWIAAALHSEWGAALLEGWLAACRSQCDAGWAAALITNVCLLPAKKGEPVDDHWRRQAIAPLLKIMPPDNAQQLVQNALGDHHADEAHVTMLLASCDFPWNESLSAAAIDFLYRQTRTTNALYDQPLRQLITDVAPHRLAPALENRLAERLGAPVEVWSTNFAEAVQELIDTVRFRREMLAALAPLPAHVSPGHHETYSGDSP